MKTTGFGLTFRAVVGKLFKPRATYKIFNPAAGQRPIFENKTITIKP